MAAESNIRSDVDVAIAPALRSGAGELEIGCLRHLASTADELPPNPTTAQVIQQARQDSRNLGLSLARSNPSMMRLLSALAIGSAPGKQIGLAELAFLLRQDQVDLPGKGPGSIGYSFGGSLEPDPFPSYYPGPTLSDDTEQQLNTLRGRQFVSIVNQLIQFTHPFYRAAAQTVLHVSTTATAKLAIRLFERALFCLSPLTATAAITNAQWLYPALDSYPYQREQVFNLSKMACSLFFRS